MNTSRNILFVLIMLYLFIFFYIIFQFFVTKSKGARNQFVIQQPICVVKFNSRYLLLNKDEIIFKISDIPIAGYPIIYFNDYFIYKNDLAKLSIEQLSYISKIDFKQKIIYINIGYKLFFNSWKDVLNHFDNTITKLIKKEPGNYFLLSGGSLISIY
ncbi:hypothetical protein X275_10395 [Marinitoga sp. 1197]|nr:hypothetical protein X275_10395 [Marinitoga sp. 1197]